MGNHNPNGGRPAPTDEDRPSWRPQDQDASSAQRHRGNEDDRDYGSWRERNQDRPMNEHDPSRWEGSRGSELASADDAWRSPEPHGQRQSGYSAGRHGDDPRHMQHRDDRSGGRGPERGRPWSAYDGPQRPAMARNDMRGQRASEPSWGNQMGGAPGAQPQRGTGPHRGKGPVGYQRSDERIRELVSEALTDDDQIDASQIHVEVKDGEVTLTGLVDDRRTRREAEDCVANVPGVRDVQVQLRVKGDRQAQGQRETMNTAPASSSHADSGQTRHEAGTSQDKKPRA